MSRIVRGIRQQQNRSKREQAFQGGTLLLFLFRTW